MTTPKEPAQMPDAFDAWADDYIFRQYPFYNPETCASIGAPLKRQLHEAWKAGRTDRLTALEAALDAATHRCQKFLDTFGDVGDCVTQADINDWCEVIAQIAAVRGGKSDGK